ncbi:hypothetical protein ACQPZF_18080 [Actinosynnema sp. CS-041913]|uniref:hypothetical protein n=1 Tax=Actinosynnema sp. CS-041913 TaxID=3239917 RepID=UPI003D94909C
MARSVQVPMVAVFLVLIILAFSDEFLAGVDDAAGLEHRWDWLLVPVDTAILVVVLAVKGRFRRRVGGDRTRRITAWWIAGAGITLGLDVLASVVVRQRAGHDPNGLWFDLPVAPLYVVALAMVLAATFDADPRVLISRRLRARRPQEWARVRAAVPLLVGTLAAYFATTWWEYHLVRGGGIDQEFFAQMSQVIALLLVALGIEVGFFRSAVTDPTQRSMAVLAVSVLCLGEIMALSALTKDGDLYAWHMYAAFIATVEACLVAFATLIWVLIIRRPADTAVEEAEPAAAPVVPPTVNASVPRTAALGFGLGVVTAVLVWGSLRRRR